MDAGNKEKTRTSAGMAYMSENIVDAKLISPFIAYVYLIKGNINPKKSLLESSLLQ